MANFCIITNNPSVQEKYPDISVFKNQDVNGIFIEIRNRIHKGAKLISHPLAGSVKPNESPYKSVVVSTGDAPMEMNSLQIIEDALQTLKKLPVKDRIFTETVLEDFRVIDLDLLDSAIKHLPPDYHV